MGPVGAYVGTSHHLNTVGANQVRHHAGSNLGHKGGGCKGGIGIEKVRVCLASEDGFVLSR